MVGILIKTMTNQGLCIGIIKDHIIDYDDEVVSVGVIWNDCDETTECFTEYEDYETHIYHFHDKGRWWQIDQNYHKFKRLLEGKCK